MPVEEQPLKEISKFIYRDEEKGRSRWNYMYKTDGHGKGIGVEEIDTAIMKK